MTAFDLEARLRLLPLLCRAALPPMPVRALCARARARYRLGCARRGLLAQLPDFDLAQFDALLSIAAALEGSEAELAARLVAQGPLAARLSDEAAALRERFVRAARYFLRHSPEAQRQLGALSHERSLEPLAIDLGRIAELAARHELSLKRAAGLPDNLAATARRLASALCLNEEGEAVRAIQERRNALYWLLSEAEGELASALRYLEPDACGEGEGDLLPAQPLSTNMAFERRAAEIPALGWALSQRADRARARAH